MEAIKWENKYEIGVKIIDDQHKRLIKLINKVIDESNEPDSAKLIADTLEEMLSYALTHFKTEEAILKEAGYPQFTEHRKEHLDFIKKTSELSIKFDLSNNELRNEILGYLKDWLMHHIFEEDLEFRDFLKEKAEN